MQQRQTKSDSVSDTILHLLEQKEGSYDRKIQKLDT